MKLLYKLMMLGGPPAVAAYAFSEGYQVLAVVLVFLWAVWLRLDTYIKRNK